MSPAAPRRAEPALGRYEVLAPLGRGATSTVYRARDRVDGREVALKAVPVELGLHGRVEREVHAAAMLAHPGLVPILDWGEDDEHLYIVSELVEGTPLDRLFREGGLEGREDILLHAVADVLDALEHAHARGVVHRDVKPANVILGADGHARLTDLGVARVVGESGLTLTGGVVGTVAYMSPEQASGRPATGASDVYSACLMLYEGLVGRNPLVGGGPAEVARRAAAADIPPIGRLRRDLPPRLVAAVETGLSRDPARRPPPGALARALRASAETWARGRRTPRRLARAAPVLASAAGGGLLVSWAVARTLDPGAGWAAAAGLAAAAAAARAPRAAAVAGGLGGLLLLGSRSPGAALVLGPLGAAVLAAAPRRCGRAWLLPAAAPALAALGLAPLFAVAAGLLRSTWARAWTALAGGVALLAWQVLAGGEALALARAPVAPAVDALRGVREPSTAARRLLAPLREHPEALLGAALLAAFALAFPLVMRARPGPRRLVAATAWALGLSLLQIAVADAGAGAIETLLPSCILLVAWAARPWRLLARRAESPSTAILRGPAT